VFGGRITTAIRTNDETSGPDFRRWCV
jgi:hypothetical protein